MYIQSLDEFMSVAEQLYSRNPAKVPALLSILAINPLLG